MTKPLIIVESPTKIKTLKKYIGKEFNVAASAGHIRDLPVKTLGIDIEKNFKAEYVNIKDKSKVISNLKKLAKDAKTHIPLPGNYQSGLFINTAYGSRGFSSAPIGAALIRAYLLEQPYPLSFDVVAALCWRKLNRRRS